VTDRPYQELAQYHQYSPDTLVAGCLNTGEHTDGVVFPGIEPAEAIFCFVGRPSIVAAVAEIFGITVDDVADRLADEKQVTKTQVRALEKENRVLRTKLDLIVKNLQDVLNDG
jgi:hypothetical protein